MPTPTTDLVAAAWVLSIPGFMGDGAGTQLPADDTTWAAHGYVVLPVTVGGTPHSTAPVRRPVVQAECWACVPGSSKPPWGKAAALAEQIRLATYDRRTFGRALQIASNGVPFAGAKVLAARMLTEPHRVYGDQADYAGVIFNLAFTWVAAGEQIP